MSPHKNLKFKKIHFIINPASGRPEAVLFILNEVMKDTDIKWDISITKIQGDGTRIAKDLVAQNIDLIIVYGGDGTIMEVISGMLGSRVPLGILPGGTGNVLLAELGIPRNLKEAALLIIKGPTQLKTIDIGQFDRHYFTQRVSFGYETEMVKGASRTVKTHFGRLAYVIGALKGIKKIKISDYDIEIDQQKHKVQGVTCIVANTGNIGFSSQLTLDKNIDLTDGLLDVLVIKKVSIHLFRYIFRILMHGEPSDDHALVAHWQGKDIKILAHPNQSVQCDGEIVDKNPIHAKIIPQAVSMVVPRKMTSKL